MGWYAWHKLTGASYADYYAWRMNSIVRRNPQWGLNTDRSFQLDFAVLHGLQPNSYMLDYGCGALAAGVLFVDYLESDRYVGVDVSERAIDEGRNRLAARGLDGKGAELFVVHGTKLGSLAGRRFNLVWAQSVLTHMPPEDILSLFIEVKPLLAETGTVYATFARGETLRQHRFKDWYYPQEFMRKVAAEAGYTIEFASDWRHPNDPNGKVDTMMKLTPLNT